MTTSTRGLTPLVVLLVAFTGLAACGETESGAEAPQQGDARNATASPADAPPPGAPAAPAAPAAAAGPHGKYGCVQTVPRMVNGSWEYEIEQRGFITLANGRYTDPYQVAGTYRHDPATDSTFFTGGILDGANATPMEDQRLWVVIPVAGGRENRWTCGR